MKLHPQTQQEATAAADQGNEWARRLLEEFFQRETHRSDLAYNDAVEGDVWALRYLRMKFRDDDFYNVTRRKTDEEILTLVQKRLLAEPEKQSNNSRVVYIVVLKAGGRLQRTDVRDGVRMPPADFVEVFHGEHSQTFLKLSISNYNAGRGIFEQFLAAHEAVMTYAREDGEVYTSHAIAAART